MIEKLILGTAQFGMHYGINNQQGRPSRADVLLILDIARNCGINTLDTADVYGEGQAILGECLEGEKHFKVLSKFVLAPGREDVEASLMATLKSLRRDSLEAYSFHKFSDFESFQTWDQFLALKRKGLVSKIGVSVYGNEQFEKAARSPMIDIIQFPYNLLDNHGKRAEQIQRAKAAGKTLHCRSIFLQGLFFMSTDALKAKKLERLAPSVDRVQTLSRRWDRPVNELCLLYALQTTMIDGVLIGIDSPGQLEQNLQAMRNPLNQVQMCSLDTLETESPELLSPAAWPRV